ncbi:arsenate reductase (glutaredoxin) [Halomonas sp. AOP12-C2-37]|uniref:arsenate reductase (glutaredoxin) n=1 Tax=unclassified Halomonas TaxID=2609666 RepID=UPI004033E3E5
MKTTIYHNPACGTSRNTLAMLEASGETPKVVEYLKTPLSRERLVELISMMAIAPRELLRRKEPSYDELNLDDPALSNDQLIDAMIAHPILVNRPIVITEKGTCLCRPSELVLELLANPVTTFTKEDGDIVHLKGHRK